MHYDLQVGNAQEIANLPDWGIVYIVVNNAVQVNVGANQQELSQKAVSGQPTGIPYSNLTPPTTVLWWKGHLYAVPIGALGSIEVETPGNINVAGYRPGR